MGRPAIPGSFSALKALLRPRYALVDFGARARAQVQCARLMRASGSPITETAVCVATASGSREVEARPTSSDAIMTIRRWIQIISENGLRELSR